MNIYQHHSQEMARAAAKINERIGASVQEITQAAKRIAGYGLSVKQAVENFHNTRGQIKQTMKEEKQQYEDGYYSAYDISRRKYIPIEIKDNNIYSTGSPIPFESRLFKDIQPLELTKPEREEGYYKARLIGCDTEVWYFNKVKYICWLYDKGFFEDDFEWIDKNKIDLK